MSLAGFSVRIDAGGRTIVSIDKFTAPQNEVTFLFGESGIGKSMISKAIYGMLDPAELSVEINGRPYEAFLRKDFPVEVARNSFFVFQEPSSHLNSLMKITEQLREGSLSDTRGEEEVLRCLWQDADDEAIRRVIDIYPKPYRPSGGEKQRVLLAMAFKKIALHLASAEKTPRTLFVFDEPTGSLDDNYRNLFLSLLFEKFEKRPFTVLLITHDYSMISEVYGKYRRLIDRIHFRELRRESDGAVALHDFSGEDYLDWLSQTRGSRHEGRAGEPVLTVAPRLSVFGRTLVLSRERGGSPAEFVVRGGEMAYIKAPSGVGKTTLAKVVMGLYRADEFSMKLEGMTLTHRSLESVWRDEIWGRRAGMVFQHADEALNLEATVMETFAGLPLKPALDREAVAEQLRGLFDDDVNEAFLDKKVGLLSGGQKQRLNLLRTLVMNTKLVILDEPLNGLDFESIQRVLAILERKRREGTALLMISHNEEIFDALVPESGVYHLSEE